MKNSSKLLLITLILSLGTGRWGAWIGFPQEGIFLFDIMLFMVFVLAFFERHLRIPSPSFILLSLFIFWQYSRNPLATEVIRIRDLLPFVYLVVFWIIRDSINGIPTQSLLKGLRLASLVSFIWNCCVSLQLIKPFMLNPVSGIEIFSQRPDHAGVVAGIGCLAWGSSWAYPENHRNSYLKVALPYLFLIQTLLTSSRAGFIATAFCFAWTIIFDSNSYFRNRKIEIFTYIGILTFLISPLIYQLLPQNSSFSRIGINSINEVAKESGSRTALARRNASTEILNWMKVSKNHLLGAGPGYEILIESGAVRWLSGSLEVRYPHNWWLSLYSRYGMFGFFLWVFIFIRNWSPLKTRGQFKTPIICSILIVSSLGVIMESPFGLLPLCFFIYRDQKLRLN